MGKIKLNLVSGAVVEKPLINAFKANNNSYVVLDNEMNGSMGLPIILVCKLENGKLTKILDQNEWGIVKEYLKNIIAGNQIEFIKVENEISADDIYYTRLTLPVPSFDALKNAYKVEETPNVNNEVSIMDIMNQEVANVEPVAINPTPVVEQVQSPVVEPSVAPVMPQVEESVVSSEPVIEIPTSPIMPQTPVNPVMNDPVSNPVPPIDVVSPINIEPEITPTPVIEPVVNVEPIVQPTIEENVETVSNTDDVSVFKEQKEAFMQACENMFDALVQKFERELENRK